MSERSDRESLDPPAFGGDDTESEEPSQYVCSEEESSDTEGLVEGTIESRMVLSGVERVEPSEDSGAAAYREMQRNYIELEAIANARGFEQPAITIRVCGYSRGFGFRRFRHPGRCSVAEAEYADRSEIGPAAERF